MQKYIDHNGIVWVRISEGNVQRIDNGVIGGWFNGDRLWLVKETK